MLESIMDTLRGIIHFELPKNQNNIPTLYTEEIRHWYYGDRSVIAETPSILFTPKNVDIKKISYNTFELTYHLTVSGWARSKTNELSERYGYELTRLIYYVLLKHHVLWVCTPCWVCKEKIFSPEHYTIKHPQIFNQYLTQSQNNFNTLWLQSHFSTDPSPTWTNSGLAVESLNLLYNDVINGVGVTNVDITIQEIFLSGQQKLRKPVVLLYDVNVTDVNPATEPKEQEILKGGEFTITAKERVIISSFGPDNVPKDYYDWQPITGN
jgi:hypothetical protein